MSSATILLNSNQCKILNKKSDQPLVFSFFPFFIYFYFYLFIYYFYFVLFCFCFVLFCFLDNSY